MPDDPEDDDAEGGAPPDPLDRVWFHPSEVGAAMAAWRSGAATAQHRQPDWGFAAIVALVSVAVTVGVLALAGVFSGHQDSSQRGSGSPVAAAPAESNWADVTASATPSIVSVRVSGPAGASVGSGVALDGSRVLTAASLVGAASSITVASTGGHLSTARVLGTDPATDVAVLLVNDGGLTGARIDHSDELRVGDSVVAIGLDEDNQPWPAQGIVSALHRVVALPSGGVLPSMVSTDVAVPPVDAGGALVDSDGGVVGILSAPLPGQAVPIDLAEQVASQLENGGQVEHGWLGVAAVDATSRPGGGAEITVVVPGSPAAQAGLEPGDVVTRISTSEISEQVNDAGDLVASVEELFPGDPVTITAWRGTGHPDLKPGVLLTNRPAPTPVLLGIAA